MIFVSTWTQAGNRNNNGCQRQENAHKDLLRDITDGNTRLRPAKIFRSSEPSALLCKDIMIPNIWCGGENSPQETLEWVAQGTVESFLSNCRIECSFV